MTMLPLHVDISGYGVADNCLVIGGQKLSDLVPARCEAPCYLYDGELIRQRVMDLRNSVPAEIELHYAMKANPMSDVVRLMASLVDGIDVASGGELDLAVTCNLPRQSISFAGPGKTDSELEAAISAGIVINVESETELRRIIKIAECLKREANVGLRINPDFELRSSGMKMSGGPKPFGIDAEAVPEILQQLTSRSLKFHGFHIFTGSQSLNSDAVCEAQQLSIDLSIRLARYAPVPPRFVNIGGGFGIPYFPGDRRLDVQAVGENLHRLVPAVRSIDERTKIVIELGRFLVGEAGLYVCQIVDIKTSRGQKYLVTNGGLHHHLAASGNFGQVIRKNYPVLIGNRIHGEVTDEVNIVGPLCTPLDIIASNVSMPRAEVGDLVVVFQSGAYGLSASPRAFLGHPDAQELLL